MEANDPAVWPSEFATIERHPPEGWLLFRSVLDPVLVIRREGGKYVASLHARLVRKSGVKLLASPSTSCNWVYGAGVIHPLPTDVAQLIRSAIGGPSLSGLTFPQVLSIQRSPPDGLRVELDGSVFEPANDEAANCEAIESIPDLQATLYGYQAKGISWMSRAIARTGGVILADEMGLGKTIQILGLLLLEAPTFDSPALVVCPTTLIANWVREIDKFAPILDVVIHRGPERARLHRQLRKSKVVITTYDTLVNDLVLFKAVEWSWLICDEAQAIKNPDSRRRIAVGEIPRLRAIPVTGTPVENHLLDLWSLSDVAIPGILGSRREFEARYPDTDESARALARVTSPIVLRRLVRDVAADLPERVDIVVPLELTDSLAAEYDAVRLQSLARYAKAGAMVATGQLQLFCADPSLTATDLTRAGWEEYADRGDAPSAPTPKLERAIELIEEAFANGKKVLLFSNFNACGPIIMGAARHVEGAYWGSINGSTPSEERQGLVDSFSTHAGPAILILNPRAAGSGLNITAATVVIHYTQVWNPALEQQASARAHRRGQTQPVTVYYLFYVDTVEEVMMDRAQRRRELGAEAVPPMEQDGVDLLRALSITPLSS